MFEIVFEVDGDLFELELDYYQFQDFVDWAEDHEVDFDVEYIG